MSRFLKLVVFLIGIDLAITQSYCYAQNPLPYVSVWNLYRVDTTNTTNDQEPGSFVISRLQAGDHILPQLKMGINGANRTITANNLAYIDSVKNRGLPFILRSTNFEDWLTDYAKYSTDLSVDSTPQYVDTSGVRHNQITPFGSITIWDTLAVDYVNTSGIKDIMNEYPNPPYVIWLSNNEARILNYGDYESDKRFYDAYHPSYPDIFTLSQFDQFDFESEVHNGGQIFGPDLDSSTGFGYIPRYRKFFSAIRRELPEWSDKLKFVGYNEAYHQLGVDNAWVAAGNDNPPIISYYDNPDQDLGSMTPYTWDGASPEFYFNNWQGDKKDFQLYSPETESQNWIAQLAWFRTVNPDFYWSISTWVSKDIISAEESAGRPFGYNRIRGNYTFALWGTRPQLAEHFADSNTGSTQIEWERFKPLLDAVNQINNNPVLANFWEYGDQLKNNVYGYHPWQYNIPDVFLNRNRWVALNSSVSMHDNYMRSVRGVGRNWNDTKYDPVGGWFLGFRQGESPNREWLIYGFTPLGDVDNVDVYLTNDAGTAQIDTVTMDVKQQGTYYVHRENGPDYYVKDNYGSFRTYNDQYWVSLESENSSLLSSYSSVSPTDVSSAVNDPTDYPIGLIHFTLEKIPAGENTIVTLTLHANAPQVMSYWKYGPTPDNPTDHWYEFMYNGQVGAEINGNVIQLHFIDGQLGDDDLNANGIITDDGGPHKFGND